MTLLVEPGSALCEKFAFLLFETLDAGEHPGRLKLELFFASRLLSEHVPRLLFELLFL